MAPTVVHDGLRVRLLGPFEIEGVDVGELRSRKARTLLKVLALAENRPVAIDVLVDRLWGDDAPARPEREVAVNASRARSLVGSGAVERSDAGYRLRTAWCDVTELAEREREAQRRIDAGDFVGARAAATAGAALVRGELLCDEADPSWAAAEITASAARVASLRRLSARAALGLGALGPAASEAELALAHDPLDEESLRVLMAARAASGRPGSALAAYGEMRARLAEELGVDPAPETEDLHTAIVRGEAVPGPTSDTGTGEPVLPGREPLLVALDAARAGLVDRPLIVALEGEPGAGKTAVLDAAGRRAMAAGATVLWARCDERGVELPLEPLAVALGAEMDRRDAAERARVLGDDLAAVGPLLGAPPPANAAAPPGPVGSPAAARLAMFEAVGRVLVRLAGDAPLVLLLDDAHRAEASTREWLAHLRRRRHPGLLVVLARRRVRGDPAAVEADEVLTIGPLDLVAARQIVGGARAAELLERSGGNALLLVEMARAEPSDDLPSSIRAAVITRVADPAVAATLCSAAVLGDEVDLDLVAGVLRRPAVDVLDDLEAGLDAALIGERGSRLVFRHSLIRDALAGEITGARRALLHRDAARILADRPGSDPLVVAHHARVAGEDALAAEALGRGAALAAARFELPAAERLLDEAISLDRTAERLVQRGRVRLARADLDGADADGVAAVAGAPAAALELRAWAARFRHDMDSAIRLGTEASARAEDPTTAASAHLAVAFARRGVGDLRAAEAEVTAAIDTPGSADIGARGWLGVLRVHQGRPEEALDLLEPAIGAEVDAVHGFWVEHTLQNAAHAYAMTGRVMEASAALERLDRELDRRGSRVRYAGLVENYRSWIMRNLADDGAVDLSEEAVAVTAMEESRTEARLDLADAHLRRGDLAAAGTHLDRARGSMQRRWFQNRWRCQARLGLLEAHAALAAGEWERAARAAGEVATTAAARGDERYAVLARLAAARALARAGAVVDLDGVDADLRRLPRLAALESWWTVAAVTADLGVPHWRPRAEAAAESLARGLGPGEGEFRVRAARVLDRILGG